MKLRSWISAFRLRTLPLAFACILLGSLISADRGSFSFVTLILMFLTASSYQVLSNLSNDYGDFISGVDSKRSKGAEVRLVSSGKISSNQMKIAIRLSILGSIFLTVLTSYFGSFGFNEPIQIFLFFSFIGFVAIWAARDYTLGSSYGYKAWGDFFVIFFFGPVGVFGSFILQSKGFHFIVLLPSLSIGFLAASVLNLNNLRDLKSDDQAGKKTIALILGDRNARVYQTILIFFSLLSAVCFMFINGTTYRIDFLFLVLTPFFFQCVLEVWKAKSSKDFDRLLKPSAILCLLFSVFIGLGLLLDSHSSENFIF